MGAGRGDDGERVGLAGRPVLPTGAYTHAYISTSVERTRDKDAICMNKEQRALVRARLPGSRYANARWLYNCLLDLCTEAGCYTGTLLWLREYAGYGSGPSSAPRTTLLLDQLRRAGLIE